MKLFYKCRLCGKIYSDTHCPKSTADFIVANLCSSETVSIHGQMVNRYDTHICEKGNPEMLGFADFIGIKADEKLQEAGERAGEYADAPTMMPGA